jgi:ribosomal protein S18 acetylase RimI-like enzyme
MSSPRIILADLGNEVHQRDVVAMTDAYARDPMGNGAPLSAEVKERLIAGLALHASALVFLAYDGDVAVGIATCFVGFSTFHARPLINIHDLAVVAEQRGRGVGRELLAAVEAKARQLGCCKLTLEVLENNVKARRTYEAANFAQAAYTEAAGGALFYAKSL